MDALRARAGRPAGEFRTFLDESGLGNHPEAVQFFARLGGRFRHTEPALLRELAQPHARRRP